MIVGVMEPKTNSCSIEQNLKERLTPEQYQVCMCSATEAPFSGEYWDCKEPGTYTCVCCGEELFASESKYDSGTGWPSFFDAVNEDAISRKEDLTHNMVRVEILCKKCGSHLGHVFEDGPEPTGLRYCVNSASLKLVQE